MLTVRRVPWGLRERVRRERWLVRGRARWSVRQARAGAGRVGDAGSRIDSVRMLVYVRIAEIYNETDLIKLVCRARGGRTAGIRD